MRNVSRFLGLAIVATTGCAGPEAPPVAATSGDVTTECVRSEDRLTGACFHQTPTGTAISDFEISGDAVFFEPGSYDLTPDAREVIRRQADWLLAHPENTVRLEGTAAIGERQPGSVEALSLGERRAGAVRDYLVAAGVQSDRISVQSFGGVRVRDPRSTEAANAVNRSVQTVLVGVYGSRSVHMIQPDRSDQSEPGAPTP